MRPRKLRPRQLGTELYPFTNIRHLKAPEMSATLRRTRDDLHSVNQRRGHSFGLTSKIYYIDRLCAVQTKIYISKYHTPPLARIGLFLNVHLTFLNETYVILYTQVRIVKQIYQNTWINTQMRQVPCPGFTGYRTSNPLVILCR